MTSDPAAAPPQARLGEVAGVFLKLGLLGFGGPAAHLALMEEETVRRRAWLTREAFLDLVGVTNLLPGPNSTEMAIHLGLLRAGWPGLVVAGACFILPAALLTGALAWSYVRFGSAPAVGPLLSFVKPAIVAIVFNALVRLGRAALRTPLLALLGAASFAAALLRVHELALLGAAGLLAAVPLLALRRRLPALALLPWAGAAGAAAPAVSSVFLVFLKIGSVLFGSGYVLLAFLRSELVERRAWLTAGQLLDAVAAGQLTPGPVFSTATFVGYLVAGGPGAAAATLGIFLPAFLLVAASGPLARLIRRSRAAGAFLDGVIAASVGLMAAVTWGLGRGAIVDVPTGLTLAVSAALLLGTRLSPTWLVGGALALGAVAAAIG